MAASKTALVFDFARGRVGLLYQSVNGRAVGAFWLLTELAKTLSRRSIWFCVSVTCDFRQPSNRRW
jgi:hypothetical protein